MEVVSYLGTLIDGHEVVLTTQKYTPYVIVTNYNPDTMSWASAYGYYTNLGDMARAIANLEKDYAKNIMINALNDYSKAYNKICDCYSLIKNSDSNFEEAFAECCPIDNFFDNNMELWIESISCYLDGTRKVGETKNYWRRLKENDNE